MTYYHAQGKIPHKRHIQFRDSTGKLLIEELLSTQGFGGPYALLYHVNYPGETGLIEAGPAVSVEPWVREVNRNHRIRTQDIPSSGDYITSRRVVAFNSDVEISVASPTKSAGMFYRNGQCDELIMIVEGNGALYTPFGKLVFERGDMIIMPRGVTQRLVAEDEVKLVIVETRTAIAPPSRYYVGSQLAEHSPFCERDFRLPELQAPNTEKGDFSIFAKFGRRTTVYHVPCHPFDVVGWDGTLYPYIFNIRDFEPITRRIHSMPHESQVFGSEGVMICCAVPRMLEYHPEALPAPPIHDNIDCDEVLFSLDPVFFGDPARSQGVLTFHPRGLYHGIKAELIEKTIGMKEFSGHALMIDAFKPLELTTHAEACDDPNYHDIWRAVTRDKS